MTTLAEHLESKGITPRTGTRRASPLWRGPTDPSDLGGVTQSMLARFLCCRERFRLYALEGLQTATTWNHRLGYGEMWHLYEEYGDLKTTAIPEQVSQYVREMVREYPTQVDTILHWYSVLKAQISVYRHYKMRKARALKRLLKTLLSETTFRIPYLLSSGRIVYLRGKWDRVDLVQDGNGLHLCLVDHKTKGDIDEELLQRNLAFDLQLQFYVVALQEFIANLDRESTNSKDWSYPLSSLLYNVIRRPLSGGKGSIRKHQPSKSNPQGESNEQFYGRLAEVIAKDPDYYFMQWEVPIDARYIEEFRRQCLDPVLESMVRWWEGMERSYREGTSPFSVAEHWRHPFGIYNPMDEGGASDIDEYLRTGSEVGLHRVDSLFPELK